MSDEYRQRAREIFDDDSLRERAALYRSLGIPLEPLAILSGRSKSELCRLVDDEQYQRHLDYKKKWNRRQTEMSNKVAEQLLAAIAELSEEIRRLRSAIESSK